MTTEKAAAELRAWVAEEARRAREFDSAEHRREAFPQTATGRALAAAPLSRSARGPLAPGPLIVQREPTDGVQSGSGWQVTLTADTTIPDGGGYFTFDTVETSHGITVTVPTTEVVIPQDGVIAVQHLWAHWIDVDHDSAWRGHGSWVEIRVNGVQVAPRFEAGLSGLPYSRLGPLPGPKVAVKQGDLLAVFGHQNSGDPQPVTGRLSLGMEDPTQSQPLPVMLIQARVWADGDSEPETWDIEYLWDDDPIVSGRPGISIGVNATGGRLCDWWGASTSPAVAAPGPGGSGGYFTDWGEEGHTLNDPPGEGWEPIFAESFSGNTNVQEVALSTSPDGRMLRRNTSGSTTVGDHMVQPAVPTSGYVEVVAAVASQHSGDSAAGPIVMFDGTRMVRLSVNVNNNRFRLLTADGAALADLVELDSVAKSLSHNTIYRVRARMQLAGG